MKKNIFIGVIISVILLLIISNPNNSDFNTFLESQHLFIFSEPEAHEEKDGTWYYYGRESNYLIFSIYRLNTMKDIDSYTKEKTHKEYIGILKNFISL